jgi:hypothetical protein
MFTLKLFPNASRSGKRLASTFADVNTGHRAAQ